MFSIEVSIKQEPQFPLCRAEVATLSQPGTVLLRCEAGEFFPWHKQ